MVEEAVDAFTTTGTNPAPITAAATSVGKVGSRPATSTAKDVVDTPATVEEAATAAKYAAA